jgi:hypothetical protein
MCIRHMLKRSMQLHGLLCTTLTARALQLLPCTIVWFQVGSLADTASRLSAPSIQFCAEKMECIV